jgi:DNA polymerase-1
MSDATWTLKLFDLYASKINLDYYETFEMDIPAIASKLYISGQNVDFELLDTIRAADIATERKLLSAHPDLQGVNLNSPKQLSHLLFNVLKLPVVKVGKSGQASTDKETLFNLVLDHGHEHPMLAALGEAKAVETREKLYYKAYPNLRYPDGRIHSELRQTGTVTGRFSMGSPNLQQISKRGEGVKVRKVFIPNYEKDEDIIVSVDWSQIELRMAGHLSQDPKLLDAYNTGKDLHTVSGTNILGVSYDEMKALLANGDAAAKKARQKGKTLNFAALYGASPKRLAKFDLLNCYEAEAEAFLMAHKNGYSKYFYDYWNEQVQFATQNLYVRTMFGRTRHLPEMQSPIKAIRAEAKNKVVNSIVQGSCSELMKLSMTTLDHEELLFNSGITFMAPIHDEFVFSMKSSMAELYIPKIVEIMEYTPKGFSLPLEAAVSVGINFADQVEVSEAGSISNAIEKALSGYQSKGN